MKKKIGVLLPQSLSYPTMSKDFMNGLKLACSENFDFKIEGIGLGNDQKTLIAAIQKLIYQEDVELTTGLWGHRNLNEIFDFTESMDHPVVYSDLGAKVPLHLENRNFVFSNSLDLYGSTRALGEYFAQNNFKNIGITSCYYDIGYDFVYGMETIFNQYDDTQFAGHFITPHQPRENEAVHLSSFMEQTKPDAVFGFFNGIFAEEHAEILSASGVNKDIPMFLTPFSFTDKIISKHTGLFDQMYSVSSWFPELDTKANKLFVKNYQNKFGKSPNFFALLGYENGLIINAKLDESNPVIEIGPRGSLTNNHAENRTKFPQYLWQINIKDNACKLKKIEILPSPNLPSFAELDSQTGWHNAYLCR